MDKSSFDGAPFGGSCENNLSRAKQKSCFNLFDSSVNDSWKALILEAFLFIGNLRDINGPANFSVGHNIRNLEFANFGFDAKCLGDVSDCLAGYLFSIFLGLRADDDHFARFKDQDGAFWISFSQYNGGKSFFVVSRVLNFFGNQLQIKLRIVHVHFGKGHNILNDRSRLRHDVFRKNIFSKLSKSYINPKKWHYGSLYHTFKWEAIYLLFISENQIQIFWFFHSNVVDPIFCSFIVFLLYRP